MLKFLRSAIVLFVSHLATYAVDVGDALFLEKAQCYMNLMEQAGQCEDVEADESLRVGINGLFSENFVKIVNGSDVLAPYQSLADGILNGRDALTKQLSAARSAFGKWTFPREFILLSEIEGQYKIQISARTVAPQNDVELSILKILTFDENNQISHLDEVFLKVR